MAGPTIDATGPPNTFSSARNISATGLTVSGSGTAILAWLEFGNAAPGTVTVSWNFTGTTQAMTLLTSSTIANTTLRLYGLVNPTIGNKLLSVSWGVTASGFMSAMSFAGTFTGSTSGTGTSAFPNPVGTSFSQQTTTVVINGVPGDYTAIGAANFTNSVTLNTGSQTTLYSASSLAGGNSAGAVAPIGQFPRAQWSASMTASVAVAIVRTDVSGPGSTISQYWMRPESSDSSIDSGPWATYPTWTEPLNTPPSLQIRTLPTAVSEQLFTAPQNIQGVSIGWNTPLSMPYLRAQIPAALQPVLAEPVAPPPLGVIGWFAPLSGPPAFLVPPALPIALRTQAYIPGQLPIFPPTPFFSAIRPLSEPTLPIPSRAVYMPPATGPPANYAYDKWFQRSLSEPPAYLVKSGLAASSQQTHVEPLTAVIPPPPVLSNVHPGLNPWVNGSTFTLGQRCSFGGFAYQCIVPGLSVVSPNLDPATQSGFSSGWSSGFGTGNVAEFKLLSSIDYTSLQAAANAIMNTYAVGGLTANQVVLNWNDTPLTAPLNGAILQYYGIASNGFTTTFTCAPGESFRDGAGGNPLTFNAAAGVSFDAPATGTESNASLYVYINVANVTFDGLQFRNLNPTGDTGPGDILIGIDTSGGNFTFQNGILDGRSLCYFSPPGCNVLNSLLVSQQTNNPAAPQWPIKYDTNATGKVVNCTCVGFNPTGGNASMVTTIGIGPVNITNCAAFGLPDPFFCQNTGGSIIVDHCATSVASFSTNDGCTDAGGNLFNKNIANQFINQVNNFRLKAGADCINAGRTDTVDIPSALDIFRTPRPQAGAWDIGAFEFVFPLVWLSALSSPPPATILPIAIRATQPVWEPLIVAATETTTVDRYHQPLSRVVPAKPGLLPHLVQSATGPVTTRTAETTTVDRWLASYPAMAPGRSVHPSVTPSYFAPVTTTFPETISRDRWQPVYPDRVPGRAIHPSAVPFRTAQPISPTFRETTSLDRWYSPLSIPQLWRTTFREQATATEAWIAVQTIPVAKNFLPTVGSVVIQGYGPRIRRKPDLPHA